MGKEVKATVECLDTKGLQPLEKIELAARICYNSEDKAKPGGAEAFLRGQILSKGHESVIEHEGVVFQVGGASFPMLVNLLTDWPNTSMLQITTPYSIAGGDDKVDLIVSGNFRAFRDLYKHCPTDLAATFMAMIIQHTPLMNHGIVPNGTEGEFPYTYWDHILDDQVRLLWTQSRLATFNPFAKPNDTFMVGGFDGNPAIIMKHGTRTFRIDGVSRALTHQLVRHRPVAYSQRSQRYCGEADFDFIVPPDALGIKARDKFDQESSGLMIHDMMDTAAEHYSRLQKEGLKNEDARFVLPNACETNIVVTATLNQWLHMIKLRTSKHAQWEIRGVFRQIHEQIKEIVPGLPFDQIEFEE